MQHQEKNMTTQEMIEYFGSRKKMADFFDIWVHGTYRWDDTPPMLRQYQVEQFSGGELKADREYA